MSDEGENTPSEDNTEDKTPFDKSKLEGDYATAYTDINNAVKILSNPSHNSKAEGKDPNGTNKINYSVAEDAYNLICTLKNIGGDACGLSEAEQKVISNFFSRSFNGEEQKDIKGAIETLLPPREQESNKKPPTGYAFYAEKTGGTNGEQLHVRLKSDIEVLYKPEVLGARLLEAQEKDPKIIAKRAETTPNSSATPEPSTTEETQTPDNTPSSGEEAHKSSPDTGPRRNTTQTTAVIAGTMAGVGAGIEAARNWKDRAKNPESRKKAMAFAGAAAVALGAVAVSVAMTRGNPLASALNTNQTAR
ncbi:MAG: hypothetical protein MK052_01605 [Alphaproteobacteria bacterium]|nr:hypothetical protein [Alphaproteobacteria bacterium]